MATIVPAAAGVRSDTDHSFLGHPRGLAYLAFTEAWERFSYYGMQALLVLYMVRQLLLPGHVENIAGFVWFRHALERLYGGPLSVVALGSAIFGLYSGTVYLMPILGGIVSDRWLGRTRTITIGALVMAAGHFMMAFDVSFLIALACLVIGVGCVKGNLASQVGALYGPADLRRADAFQIFLLAVSAGVIVAPLVAGTLGEVYGWHYGFGAAGVGMLIGLFIYLSGRKWLPPEPARIRDVVASRPPLRREERTAVIVLIVLVPVLAVGAVGNQEIFNAYLLWAPENIDLVFFGHTMPTTWLLTVDSALSVAALVGVMAFWRVWARRRTELSEVSKITLGLFISVLGVLMLVTASQLAASGHKASVWWALAFHTINSIGYAHVFPVGLALYARASPRATVGTMIGVYYLHLFMANNLVGWLGGLSERLSGAQFWLLHAALITGATVVFLLVRKLFERQLAPSDPQPTH